MTELRVRLIQLVLLQALFTAEEIKASEASEFSIAGYSQFAAALEIQQPDFATCVARLVRPVEQLFLKGRRSWH